MAYKMDKYQGKLKEFALYGKGNAIVNAVAGAGKSSTIIEIIKCLEKQLKIALISFNRSVAEENAEKIGEGYPNVMVSTTHSLGLKILREHFSPEMCDEKYKIYIYHHLNEIVSPIYWILNRPKQQKFINNITSLVDYSRFNLCSTIEDIERIADRYGIIPIGDECEAVFKILNWGKSNIDTIDYTDMVWLPVILGLTTQKYKFDMIFIDEAQDTTPMAQKFADILKHSESRFFAVGDEDQCINSWAGADSEAFKSFMKYPDTQRFEMPVSYRCPKKIVEFVHRFVPQITSTEDAIEGEIYYDASPNEPQSGDMVLCRVWKPAVLYYMRMISINKKVVIEGGDDIMKTLIALVSETKQEKVSIDMEEDGVIARLYEKLFSEIELYVQKTGSNVEEALESKDIIGLYDNIKIIENIAQSITTASELKNKIAIIFSSTNGEGIRISTIHKAKGAQAKHVYILGRSLMPSKMAKKDWEKKEEANLEYVAYTRAQESLHFISEKEFPCENLPYKDIESELDWIKIKISKCITDSNIKTKAQELREKPVEAKPVKEKIATRKIGGNKLSMFK